LWNKKDCGDDTSEQITVKIIPSIGLKPFCNGKESY